MEDREGRRSNINCHNTQPNRRQTMHRRFSTTLIALAAVALLFCGAGQVFADGTTAGTDVVNTVSVTFTINGGTPPR